jgi:hypothetical protein
MGDTMTQAPRTFSYAEGLAEFYAGEVVGEAIYSGLLEVATDPGERLKLAHLLQLETETKAWLRAPMLAAGVSIAEPPSMRQPAAAFIASLAPLPWLEQMQAIESIISGEFLPLYRRYADEAQARGEAGAAAVCDFMAEHEDAQAEFARRELAGAPLAHSLETLTRQTRYPLPT